MNSKDSNIQTKNVQQQYIFLRIMDSSSYSEDNQVDERYIKKSVVPVQHREDEILGDPISQESKEGNQFKELLSDQDNSELRQNDCRLIKSEISQKQQHEYMISCAPPMIEPQNAAHQFILRDGVVSKPQPNNLNEGHEQLDQLQEKQQDENEKLTPFEQIQVKEQIKNIHVIRLEDYKEEIQNKIQPDENYLQYVRLKRMEFEGVKYLAQEQKIQPKVEDEGLSIQEQQKQIEKQPVDEEKQKKDNILNLYQKKANQNQNEPQMKIQSIEKPPVIIQSQNQCKKLKQEQSQPFSLQKMSYFKDAIIKQIKEQYRKMLLQQRLIRNQFINNAVAELKEVIEQKMNENREQNSRQNSSMKNIMLKVNDSINRLEERLLNLENSRK